MKARRLRLMKAIVPVGPGVVRIGVVIGGRCPADGGRDRACAVRAGSPARGAIGEGSVVAPPVAGGMIVLSPSRPGVRGRMSVAP